MIFKPIYPPPPLFIDLRFFTAHFYKSIDLIGSKNVHVLKFSEVPPPHPQFLMLSPYILFNILFLEPFILYNAIHIVDIDKYMEWTYQQIYLSTFL